MLSGWVFVCIPKWNNNDLVRHFFRPFGGKKPPTRPGELSLTSSAGGKCPKSVAKFGAQRGGFEMLGAYFQWSKCGTTLQAELETSSVLRGGQWKQAKDLGPYRDFQG